MNGAVLPLHNTPPQLAQGKLYFVLGYTGCQVQHLGLLNSTAEWKQHRLCNKTRQAMYV